MRVRRGPLVPGLVLAVSVVVAGWMPAATADDAGSQAINDSRISRQHPDKRGVMVVSNNWAGTATIVDARTHKVLTTINVVPDRDEEIEHVMTPSESHPAGAAFYLAIQQFVGEGHDQYVDDAFTTRDGKYLAVSRPSLRDLVWIDIAKAAAGGKAGDPDSIVAEAEMDGYRTDHMGVSPDGRRLVVSDSTSRQVLEFSMVDETLPSGRRVKMGQRLRSFESGDTPHENNYSANGKRIFHASIGRVYTPGDDGDFDPMGDTHKGDRWLQIVGNRSFKVRRRWDMGQELAEAGHPKMSSAVRPVAITPNEKIMYAQVSFYHGLVEFNMAKKDKTGGGDYKRGGLPEPKTGVVTKTIDLPIAKKVRDMPREQYVLDSAHHGLAINNRGSKLCVAGTMSDYAAIVDRKTFTPTVFKGAARYIEDERYSKPYWAVEGPGNTCWMSMSGSDLVTIISFAKEKVVAEVPVGYHPQRVRHGRILESVVADF
ncbi:MAG: serine/threonine protein kinase [Actinomycetota bacterium]|nr:serine/threonine protein kinase [Actinomycetota bacterium]